MAQYLLKPNQKFTDYLFFVVFFYLAFFCLIGSLLNSLTFLTTLQRYSSITDSIRICFIFFCVFQAVFPQFGVSIVSLVLNPLTQNHCLNLTKSLHQKVKSQPFLVFVCFLIYISLIPLHFLMIYCGTFEPFFEYIYQICNLIRLWYFPIFIYLFAARHLSNSIQAQGFFIELADLEKIKQYGAEASEVLREHHNKAPKLTKAVIGVGLIFSAGYLWGDTSKTTIQEIDERFGTTPKELKATACNPKLQDTTSQLLDLSGEASASPFQITFNDITRVYNSKPSLLSEYRMRAVELAKLRCQPQISQEDLLLSQSQKNVNDISLQGSYVAKALPKASSSMLDNESSVAHSCLEPFFF